MPSYEHILLRSDVKKALVRNIQRKLKKKRKKKQLGMSEVLEYLMGVEESVTLDDPDEVVE